MPLQKVLTAIAGNALPAYTFTRSSSGYQVDSDGVLRLRSTDQLRIDYLDLDNDGERETPSIVVELASTNKFTRSIEFSHSTWVKSAATVEANVAAAPDLSTQADLLVPSTANAAHFVSQTASVAASTDHALSVYAAPSGYRFLTLDIENSSANAAFRTQFELSSSGVVMNSTTLGVGVLRRSHIDRVRSGVYRCTVVGSISTSTGANARLFVEQTSAQMAAAWAGGGSSAGLGIMLWGAQLEESMPAETSLMQSSAATASRAAETLYVPFPYTPREMTVYAKVQWRNSYTGANGPRLWEISDGSDNGPRVLCYDGGTQILFYHQNTLGGTAVQTSVAAAPSYGDIVEVVLHLKGDGAVGGSVSVAGAAESAAVDTSAHSLAGAWAGERLYVNSGPGATLVGINRLLDLKVDEGVQSMAYMRSLAPFFVIDGIAIPVAEGSVREDRVEVGDRARTFDGTNRETIRGQYSVWQAETPPLTVGDRNRVAQALEKSTQPHTSYGAMTRTSTGLLPQVFSRKTGEALVQSSTDRRYSLAFTVEQSS